MGAVNGIDLKWRTVNNRITQTFFWLMKWWCKFSAKFFKILDLSLICSGFKSANAFFGSREGGKKFPIRGEVGKYFLFLAIQGINCRLAGAMARR